MWKSNNLQELRTWRVDEHLQSQFSSNGSLLATTSKDSFFRTYTNVLCTASHEFRASFWVNKTRYSPRVQLAFLNEDAHLLYGSDPQCRIWDIATKSCLFAFDIDNPDTAIILFLSREEHIMVVSHRVIQISTNIAVENVTANKFAAYGLRDGQPTFLEVRDDTLWECDRYTERPLCWLPILWRWAFNNRNMIWSGPVLVFGLQGGDFGILNIDSLRRACTSTRRARKPESEYVIA